MATRRCHDRRRKRLCPAKCGKYRKLARRKDANNKRFLSARSLFPVERHECSNAAHSNHLALRRLRSLGRPILTTEKALSAPFCSSILLAALVSHRCHLNNQAELQQIRFSPDSVRARWRARAPRRGSESTRAFLPVSKYVATLDVQLRLSNADFECPLSSPAKPPLGDQDSCNQSASTLAFVH